MPRYLDQVKYFPQRSPGVLVAGLSEKAVAYDLATETAHLISTSAATLLDACNGRTNWDAATQIWAAEAGVANSIVEEATTVALQQFSELGLVGRTSPFHEPRPPMGSIEAPGGTSSMGAVHRVVDHRIAFRSSQPELLAAIDDYLGTGRHDIDPTLVFDVHLATTGEVRLLTDEEWEFPDLEKLLNQLMSVLNEYVCWTHTCAVLHAGAVRSPDGEVVALVGPPGSGKSTLAGAFVAAGWDYLSDEAVGVRPHSLVAVGYPKRFQIDQSSCEILGLDPCLVIDQLRAGCGDPSIRPSELAGGVVELDGDVGPINRILFPVFAEDSEIKIEGLPPDQSVIELLTSTLNLSRAGQGALNTVCDLAASVPAYRLSHGDVHSVVALVSSGALSA